MVESKVDSMDVQLGDHLAVLLVAKLVDNWVAKWVGQMAAKLVELMVGWKVVLKAYW